MILELESYERDSNKTLIIANNLQTKQIVEHTFHTHYFNTNPQLHKRTHYQPPNPTHTHIHITTITIPPT